MVFVLLNNAGIIDRNHRFLKDKSDSPCIRANWQGSVSTGSSGRVYEAFQ
jgi:hypothetical protein